LPPTSNPQRNFAVIVIPVNDRFPGGLPAITPVDGATLHGLPIAGHTASRCRSTNGPAGL
jgi:hypothetical protein